MSITRSVSFDGFTFRITSSGATEELHRTVEPGAPLGAYLPSHEQVDIHRSRGAPPSALNRLPIGWEGWPEEALVDEVRRGIERASSDRPFTLSNVRFNQRRSKQIRALAAMPQRTSIRSGDVHCMCGASWSFGGPGQQRPQPAGGGVALTCPACGVVGFADAPGTAKSGA